MKFDENKKRAINAYILEKVEQNCENLSETVSETFGINRNTAHKYINNLVQTNVIKRVKRGVYCFVKNVYQYEMQRSKGELSSDTYAYDKYFRQHIQNMPDNVKEIWEYTFSEMMNNVMDHSNAENLTLIVEQNELQTAVYIIDDGVGIFEKIKNYFNLDTAEEAICELFKGKLTTDSENHSGEGIFFSSKIMDEFFILSGKNVFSNNKYNNSRVFNLPETVNGTAVFMALSNSTHKHTCEIFDLYANVDGGFTKTLIPLKNIFENSPVSRSQARRVCNRLDKFQEVTLDFEGLEWMGQGFAHQIFSVFAKQNPQIKLIPINMCEAVSKMYNHVTRA